MAHDAPPSRTTNSVPEQRAVQVESAADLLPTGGSVRPVPFDRMLLVAVLTPAQASLVAVQLLDAAHLSGTVDGQPYDDTRLGAVTFGPTGVLDVGRPRADDGDRISDLLSRLLRNAHRLPAHPRQSQLVLLHRLEEATREPLHEPDLRARRLESALAETLGSGARARLTGELAALVDAFAHLSQNDPTPTAAPAGPPQKMLAPATAPAPVPRRGSGGRTPRRSALFKRRKRGRVVLAVLLVAALVVGGWLFLRGPGARFNPFAGSSKPASSGHHAPVHHAKKAAHKQQPHHPRAVPALAPRQAGAVTAVAVQKAGACPPGALCPVRVTVHFHPVGTSRPVAWRVGVARVCTHHVTLSAPTTMTAQAGWTTAYAHSSIHVPKGRFALFALTSAPARAQSPPVPVAGASLRC